MNHELDALKSALQAIDQRMARRMVLDMEDRRKSGLARLQRGLWPMWLGQILQILFGVLCIALGAAVWTGLRDGSAIFWSGIIVHVYGIGCIVLAGMTLGMLARIDRGESLLAAQTRLARLRRLYVLGGMAVGLAWWLFWIPFMATLFNWLGGADLYANVGWATIGSMVAVGVAGLLGTWWFHRWSRRPGRPGLAKAMDDAVTGFSLARAQRRLDELKAFDAET